MDNAERFLNAYASVEREMRVLCGDLKYVAFGELISRCRSENIVISANAEILREYHELRNAIVHQRGPSSEIVAQPCDAVVENFERIAALLQKRNTAIDYASTPVRVVHRDTDIRKAYDIMTELQTSKLPVYDSGIYKGVLTLEEICAWAIHNPGGKAAVGDILQKRKEDKVRFVSSDTSVQVVLQTFRQALDTGSNLLAILITENGKQNGDPEGIITIYDLPKILDDFR